MEDEECSEDEMVCQVVTKDGKDSMVCKCDFDLQPNVEVNCREDEKVCTSEIDEIGEEIKTCECPPNQEDEIQCTKEELEC